MEPSARAAATRCWVLLLLVSVLVGRSVALSTDPTEIQALLAFKESLDDPDGNLNSWTTNTDPCGVPWLGVICDNSTGGYSHVTELRMLSLNLGGQLVEELGSLQSLQYLDVMWNRMSGSIPHAIGNLTNLILLLLNGNQFTGVLPNELGNLSKMIRIQIDQNLISGNIPPTFAKLTSIQHLHMNNNSLNGSLPEGLGSLPDLVHVLVDSNQLTGPLPLDLANAPSLLIIQLDNNQLGGVGIPTVYAEIPTLLKLSMRNCSLQGTVPDFSKSTNLGVLDLSYNSLTGPIPTTAFPSNMTAIDMSYNHLNGSVPPTFDVLQNLQYLELRNNNLSGNISAGLGTGASFSGNTTNSVILDFQNNDLELSDGSNLPRLQGQSRVQVWLAGNPPACSGPSNPLCISTTVGAFLGGVSQTPPPNSQSCSACNSPYALVPSNNDKQCRCAVPITVLYRLKSPGFAAFDLYEEQFLVYISQGLHLAESQVQVLTYEYQPGPRIQMTLLLFPVGLTFNDSEVNRLDTEFTDWQIPDSTVFGPYELIQFIPPGSVSSGSGGKSGLSGGAVAGIVIAFIFLAAILAAVVMFCCLKRHGWDPKAASRKVLARTGMRRAIKVAGVRTFTFEELVKATDNFSDKNILGQGGYGKVYYGVLEDKQKVAVKRAEEGSLQGATEFETEIQLLSRVHHRNLLSLVGYCNDEGEHSQGEQMLVYEYISNGSLRDHLSKSAKLPMDIVTRLRIALGSARGIHYLHTQADPPIFHRDIKASNILLDDKFNAKVADFGLSKLAPSDVDFEGGNAGHVSTVVKGTPGYLDPEYFLTHKLTDKSDVYSFGVVLLELMTAMPPISQGKNIIRQVSTAYSGGGLPQVIDSRMGSYPMDTVEPFIRLALACCHSDTDARPSMADVLHELEEIWKDTPWSDVGSHSYVGDLGDAHDLRLQTQYSSEMTEMSNLFDTRSDVGSTSDLLSRTNINVLPR